MYLGQEDSDEEEADRTSPPRDKGAGGDQIARVKSPPKQEKETEENEEAEEEEMAMSEEQQTLQMVGAGNVPVNSIPFL